MSGSGLPRDRSYRRRETDGESNRADTSQHAASDSASSSSVPAPSAAPSALARPEVPATLFSYSLPSFYHDVSGYQQARNRLRDEYDRQLNEPKLWERLDRINWLLSPNFSALQELEVKMPPQEQEKAFIVRSSRRADPLFQPGQQQWQNIQRYNTFFKVSFFGFKTPVDPKVWSKHDGVPAKDAEPSMPGSIIQTLQNAARAKLDLVIPLTKTNKYYHPQLHWGAVGVPVFEVPLDVRKKIPYDDDKIAKMFEPLVTNDAAFNHPQRLMDFMNGGMMALEMCAWAIDHAILRKLEEAKASVSSQQKTSWIQIGIHCTHGVDRTGLLIAYWTMTRANRDLKTHHLFQTKRGKRMEVSEANANRSLDNRFWTMSGPEGLNSDAFQKHLERLKVQAVESPLKYAPALQMLDHILYPVTNHLNGSNSNSSLSSSAASHGAALALAAHHGLTASSSSVVPVLPVLAPLQAISLQLAQQPLNTVSSAAAANNGELTAQNESAQSESSGIPRVDELQSEVHIADIEGCQEFPLVLPEEIPPASQPEDIVGALSGPPENEYKMGSLNLPALEVSGPFAPLAADRAYPGIHEALTNEQDPSTMVDVVSHLVDQLNRLRGSLAIDLSSREEKKRNNEFVDPTPILLDQMAAVEDISQELPEVTRGVEIPFMGPSRIGKSTTLDLMCSKSVSEPEQLNQLIEQACLALSKQRISHASPAPSVPKDFIYGALQQLDAQLSYRQATAARRLHNAEQRSSFNQGAAQAMQIDSNLSRSLSSIPPISPALLQATASRSRAASGGSPRQSLSGSSDTQLPELEYKDTAEGNTFLLDKEERATFRDQPAIKAAAKAKQEDDEDDEDGDDDDDDYGPKAPESFVMPARKSAKSTTAVQTKLCYWNPSQSDEFPFQLSMFGISQRMAQEAIEYLRRLLLDPTLIDSDEHTENPVLYQRGLSLLGERLSNYPNERVFVQQYLQHRQFASNSSSSSSSSSASEDGDRTHLLLSPFFQMVFDNEMVCSPLKHYIELHEGQWRWKSDHDSASMDQLQVQGISVKSENGNENANEVQLHQPAHIQLQPDQLAGIKQYVSRVLREVMTQFLTGKHHGAFHSSVLYFPLHCLRNGGCIVDNGGSRRDDALKTCTVLSSLIRATGIVVFFDTKGELSADDMVTLEQVFASWMELIAFQVEKTLNKLRSNDENEWDDEQEEEYEKTAIAEQLSHRYEVLCTSVRGYAFQRNDQRNGMAKHIYENMRDCLNNALERLRRLYQGRNRQRYERRFKRIRDCFLPAVGEEEQGEWKLQEQIGQLTLQWIQPFDPHSGIKDAKPAPGMAKFNRWIERIASHHASRRLMDILPTIQRTVKDIHDVLDCSNQLQNASFNTWEQVLQNITNWWPQDSSQLFAARWEHGKSKLRSVLHSLLDKHIYPKRATHRLLREGIPYSNPDDVIGSLLQESKDNFPILEELYELRYPPNSGRVATRATDSAGSSSAPVRESRMRNPLNAANKQLAQQKRAAIHQLIKDELMSCIRPSILMRDRAKSVLGPEMINEIATQMVVGLDQLAISEEQLESMDPQQRDGLKLARQAYRNLFRTIESKFRRLLLLRLNLEQEFPELDLVQFIQSKVENAAEAFMKHLDQALKLMAEQDRPMNVQQLTNAMKEMIALSTLKDEIEQSIRDEFRSHYAKLLESIQALKLDELASDQFHSVTIAKRPSKPKTAQKKNTKELSGAQQAINIIEEIDSFLLGSKGQDTGLPPATPINTQKQKQHRPSSASSAANPSQSPAVGSNSAKTRRQSQVRSAMQPNIPLCGPKWSWMHMQAVMEFLQSRHKNHAPVEALLCTLKSNRRTSEQTEFLNHLKQYMYEKFGKSFTTTQLSQHLGDDYRTFLRSDSTSGLMISSNLSHEHAHAQVTPLQRMFDWFADNRNRTNYLGGYVVLHDQELKTQTKTRSVFLRFMGTYCIEQYWALTSAQFSGEALEQNIPDPSAFILQHRSHILQQMRGLIAPDGLIQWTLPLDNEVFKIQVGGKLKTIEDLLKGVYGRVESVRKGLKEYQARLNGDSFSLLTDQDLEIAWDLSFKAEPAPTEGGESEEKKANKKRKQPDTSGHRGSKGKAGSKSTARAKSNQSKVSGARRSKKKTKLDNGSDAESKVKMGMEDGKSDEKSSEEESETESEPEEAAADASAILSIAATTAAVAPVELTLRNIREHHLRNSSNSLAVAAVPPASSSDTEEESDYY